MATISTHVGHTLSEDHNIRDEKHTSKDGHIDPSKTPLNETIYYQPIKDAYHTLFDDSVAEYNAKQTRQDRRIDDYYKKISESKQKHPAYEMIIGVYNKTDKGKVIEAEREFSDEVGKEIMKEFVAGWAERNPNLHMTGAHYHADEDGQPHIHIDFIPIVENCPRGMSRQTAFDKALQRQGFKKKEAEYELNEDGSQKLDAENKPIQKQAWSTPQMQWEASENKALEDLCLARGLTVEHPDRDAGGRKHEHTDDYKQSKDELRELQEQIAKEREAARLAAENQAAELRRLREAHDKELAEEKKAAAEKLAKERKAAEKKLQDDLAEKQKEIDSADEILQEQRSAQTKILAEEISTAKAEIEEKFEALRVANDQKIQDDFREKQTAAEAKLSDTKLACANAEQHLNDIEQDIIERTQDADGLKEFTQHFRQGATSFLGFTVWKKEDADTMRNNYRTLWKNAKNTRDLAKETTEKMKHLNQLETDLQTAKDSLAAEKDNRKKEQDAHNKAIKDLKAEIKAKNDALNTLKRQYADVKRCVYKVLNYFGIGNNWDTYGKLRAGCMAEDFVKREQLMTEYKPLSFEKLGFVTLTVQEDEIGVYGLLENKKGDKRFLTEKQVFNLTEGMENVYHGNSAGFEEIELQENLTIKRKLYSPSQYYKRDKQITLSDSLKQQMKHNEIER